ncbi:site-specific DNA-methyltransferase [Thiomonas sp. FB-Cd]|uniref:site-specific DNA-methyltransferase n=1 Tax=Thiomonas sp. FB-Cd TaxID=1158292 RepID=UPI0004DF2D92|nr:site-specific DNA-methyltransferase [Thiomonas sp. FB-Cd]
MANPTTTNYTHSQEATQRPDVGLQDQFSAKRPAKTYRYDSSLDPALSWDENRNRDLAEWLICLVQRCATEGEAMVFAAPQVWAGGGVQVQSLKAAADLLKSLSQPFLNWAGKAERHQIEVPTVPLFVHERQSTKAILDGIKSRKAKGTTLDLFGDGGLDVTDKLDAYEHKGPWQNRMILGDSLQIMNSLLEFEGLGGQVQMVYMDPPYGVKFGSNFQPFIRRRDVKHGGDDDMTREPEMVKAYRDTWEMGLHSYLTYMRDRLLLAKELLNESGSIFVQIADENIHHVREILDEIFGERNFSAQIAFKAADPLGQKGLARVYDYILWYAKDAARQKYRPIFKSRDISGDREYKFIDDKSQPLGYRVLSEEEFDALKDHSGIFRRRNLTSSGFTESCTFEFELSGKTFYPAGGKSWSTNPRGIERLKERNRLFVLGKDPYFKSYQTDFPWQQFDNCWTDKPAAKAKLYVVQTAEKFIERCMLMCSDPGDLVLDTTCGSGTTAYVAEQWGRRWITCDTSRVPLALARQRLLTATFPYYELKSPQAGPVGGFEYRRRQNRKGEEVGGLVPHITLKSIANDEAPATEVLVDRPEVNTGVVRVAGPFVVEATIAPVQVVDDEPAAAAQPASAQLLDDAIGAADAANGGLPLAVADPAARYGDPATHIERMTQVLRQSKTLRLPGNRELVLADIRRMSDSDVLHAEAVDTEGQRIGIVFGPEDGAISSDVVFEAAREAYFLKFLQLYFFGFAIQAKARELLEDRAKLRIACNYVTVTPDVAMSDLLKTSRASEIFSVTGLPDTVIRKTGKKNTDGADLYEVELLGLDIFNPATMDQESIEGQNMPAWMLDTDYDGMCFYATQVFFPKTATWDNLQKSLKAEFDPSVWSHLAGTVSEPFALGPKRRVAVKVIDERGNELMRVLEVKA